MTRAALAIKRSIPIIVVILSSIGLTTILGNVSISLKVHSKNQLKPLSTQAVQVAGVNDNNKSSGDPISLFERNPKGDLIKISIPSGIMFENADREIMSNSNATLRTLILYMPGHDLISGDDQINRIFHKENLPLQGFNNFIEVKRADDEMNRLFFLGNTRIMVDQKMFASADNRMIWLFKCSNQYRLNALTPDLLFRADVEINHDFKENTNISINQANAVHTITAKA